MDTSNTHAAPTGSIPPEEKPKASFQDLNDDVFHHSLCFISTLRDLHSLSLTSKRAHRWIHHSSAGEKLQRRLYEVKYAEHDPLAACERPWKALDQIRQKAKLSVTEQEASRVDTKTLGILSP